jgi:hypothetical protein
MKSIGSALLLAQSNIAGVGKDAKNSFQNYDYVSAETMITECRRALHKAGLLFCRKSWLMTEGNTVMSEYLLTHPESGEEMQVKNEMVVPPNQKQLDKAVLAALTTGMNYTLRDLLLIPRCENEQPEIDAMEPAKAKRSAPVNKQAAQIKFVPVNPEPKEDAPSQKGMASALHFVFGLKPDPRGYEEVLLRHAGSKYEKTFEKAEDLPEEYIIEVLKAHDVDYKETQTGATK